DGLPARRDFGGGFIAGDAGTTAAAFRSDALGRGAQALLAIDPLLGVVPLPAEPAPVGGGIGIAPDRERLAVLCERQDGAGSGTVMRACTNDDALRHMRSPRRLADNESSQSAKIRRYSI